MNKIQQEQAAIESRPILSLEIQKPMRSMFYIVGKEFWANPRWKTNYIISKIESYPNGFAIYTRNEFDEDEIICFINNKYAYVISYIDTTINSNEEEE